MQKEFELEQGNAAYLLEGGKPRFLLERGRTDTRKQVQRIIARDPLEQDPY
jgi:hypothetical protein